MYESAPGDDLADCRQRAACPAVTFTIRAAAQLSQRFQNALEKRRESETNPARRARLDDALRALDSSFVGTIHAFCARLLRERPVEAGVDPAFREMDEPEDNVARAEAWERYVQSLFVANAPIIPRLSALGVRLSDLQDDITAALFGVPDADGQLMPLHGEYRAELRMAMRREHVFFAPGASHRRILIGVPHSWT